MTPDRMLEFRDVIRKPNGIVLVTGPTGSGKTTTLYAALNELNDITEKVITTEDPVEYDIEGIVQMPIDAGIGNTFAQCLRFDLAAGSGQDSGGRNPRPGDGRNRGAGVADRAHGVQHAAHQRRAQHGLAVARHGGAAVSDHGHAGSGLAHGWCGRFAPIAASRSSQHRTIEPIGLPPDDVLDRKFYRGRGCAGLQQHRLQGPHRPIRADGHQRSASGHDQP